MYTFTFNDTSFCIYIFCDYIFYLYIYNYIKLDYKLNCICKQLLLFYCMHIIKNITCTFNRFDACLLAVCLFVFVC